MLTKGIGQKAKKKKKQKESEIVKQTKNNDQEVKKTLKDMTILLRSNGEAEARLMACPRPWETSIHKWPELRSEFPKERVK